MTVEANLTELTAVIAACYVARNPIAAAEITALILDIHATLRSVAGERPVQVEALTPAVPIEESVTDEFLICLEDGQKLRLLRRYLQRKYALSPDQYRARWNLPPTYPMVAPAYSTLRKTIAKRGRTASRNGGR